MRSLVRVLLVVGVGLGVFAGPAHADPRIVGGVEVADIGEVPWMVALVSPTGRQFCGGSLVSRNVVATAAHCVASIKAEDVLVVGGRLDLTKRQGVVSRVNGIVVHPDYKNAQAGADAAILFTAAEFPYRPIPLPATNESGLYQAGKVGTVYGWGRTAESGASTLQLRKVSVPITSDAECSAAYSDYKPGAQFCAGVPQGGIDSCQGDSGGPFVVDGKLAGLVSWGTGCARPGKPGVYTRVTSYFG
ncbi:serine protease [Actinosynnema sp. NPDC020468]|uniref:serine protease n=1 Tax=Actinosynnema sp. NPDC020468 TaxID=3154488 RepID=UPI0033C524B3